MKQITKIYSAIIFAFLYLPILVLVVFSFNESKSRVSWTGFTLKWYIKLFNDNEILKALFNTFIIAVASALLATLLGSLAAVGIKSMKKFPRKFLMTITDFPIINPEIVTGVSLMLLFVFAFTTIGFLKPGIATLILAHTTFCTPYVILSVLPKLRQISPHLYEAAQDLGCPPIKAFLKVVLPDIIPGIITGMVMAFTLSLDDFVISYFNSGTTQTLPIAIYSMTRKIVSPEINALSTLLFVVILVLLVMINIRQNKEIKLKKVGETYS
ncbi:MAG: spermidine/putrescine transport system permease protein [Eubacteriales bacterium SKADARSKE-1]|nr:spermidine/putrescine transport system permease protein [Eubacteriales bacterium SKADARSKE-1]